uniref:Uncharacterized protein n=1 Tax=Candidatus Kentrum sp. FW TaxID=2126338 RepID=A0A450TKF9_9GAMM|nr:MAG: hypothetical protein BECKFW1821C_GA0114237_101329 [Candidatus Kentron sp. FW]
MDEHSGIYSFPRALRRNRTVSEALRFPRRRVGTRKPASFEFALRLRSGTRGPPLDFARGPIPKCGGERSRTTVSLVPELLFGNPLIRSSASGPVGNHSQFIESEDVIEGCVYSW